MSNQWARAASRCDGSAGKPAFVAGATNAGAFLAVSQYTSHMTGIVSSMADALVLGHTAVFLTGVGALCAFTLGAADRTRLRLLTMLLSAFFTGGVIGALGFRTLGYSATLPLAVVLLGLAAVPAVDDVRSALRDDRDG